MKQTTEVKMNKTAVDWLFDEISKYIKLVDDFKSAVTTFAIARQKEKKQIKEAFNEGYRDAEIDNNAESDKDISLYSNADNYYTQTYGGKNE